MKKNIIIIILSILVLGMVGYLVYDKVLLDDNKSIKDNQEKIEEEKYDLVTARSLIDQYTLNDFYLWENFIFNSQITENVKTFIAIKIQHHQI